VKHIRLAKYLLKKTHSW